MILITQAKESENLRNKEMKKYAEDRERGLKQQNEVVGRIMLSLWCISPAFFGLSLSLGFLSVCTWFVVLFLKAAFLFLL